MNRHDATERILDAKRSAGLTFTELAERVGADRTWLTSALLGQHPVPPELAQEIAGVLSLDAEVVAVMQEIPTRGSFAATAPPTDPTIARFYEILQVYGPALKALVHEDCGDGIMSAITFNIGVERHESDAGPRVRITMDGKFLPYTWEA